MQNNTNILEHEEPQSERPKRFRFLRKRTWWRFLLALPFLGACVGVLALVALYRWPTVNVPVYYFTVRPAFVWFCGLALFLLLGLPALRLRWFLCGCLLWLVGLGLTDDLVQTVKLTPTGKRQRFEAARMGFRSWVAEGGQADTSVNVPLRIVSWNMNDGRKGPAEAVDELASLDPDIVLIQEYSWAKDNWVRDAIKECEPFKAYHLYPFSKDAVLSRFPLERLSTEGFSKWRGGAVLVSITPRLKCVVFSIHLDTTFLRHQIIAGPAGMVKDIRERRHDLDRIREILDRHAAEGPLILGGDFNVPLHYADLRSITKGMKDCFAENGYGRGYTAPANHRKIPLPVVRVDGIFVPHDADVVYSAAVPTKFSDHYPVIAEVFLPVKPMPSVSDKRDAGEPK